MDDNNTRKLPPRPQQPPADDSEITQKLPLLDGNRLITEHIKEATPNLSSSHTSSMVTSGQSLTTSRLQKVLKQWPTWKRLLATFLLLLLLLGGGALAFGYYYFQTNIQTPLAQFVHPVSRGSDEPASNTIPSDSNVTGRVWNVLLLASDNDGKYRFPAVLTQVMMVVHIDTIKNTVTMVSIPRDSWVYVPDVGGMHKIDQAFFLGATQHNNFDDGVRQARLTVEKDYGITIDRYAWVGLGGFAKVIDTLGGLDIDVAHPVVDDIYPDDTGSNANTPFAYKRLYLPPGPQHLNGQQALEYVRSRHADLVGDIGRTQRQQQVLAALKQKLNVSSVLGNLQQLFSDLKGEVYTDVSEQEMLGFAAYGHGLSGNAIQHVTLGPGNGNQNYGSYSNVYDPSANSNQDVVIPHCDNIQPLINTIFGLGNAQSCNVTGP
jgi:polyisoprenyl-teichoic acid--peptidoglycan teichoic acid transferase